MTNNHDHAPRRQCGGPTKSANKICFAAKVGMPSSDYADYTAISAKLRLCHSFVALAYLYSYAATYTLISLPHN